MTASASGWPALYVAEPPPPYLARLPPLVVDCSVLAALVFAEAAGDAAAERIENFSLQAPWLLQVEIASVAVKKAGLGFTELASDGLAHFATFDIKLHPTDPSAVLAVSRQYRLSAYDATYLCLAAELQAPLLSFDERLAKAAQKHLGGW